MNVKKCLLLGIAVISMFAFSAISNNYASAEDEDAVAGRENKGLSVSPSIGKMGYLNLGKTYDREIIVVNHNDMDITFKVLTSSFWVEDEKYEVKWGVSDSQYGKIAGWTNIDKNKVHTVRAGETYKLEYTITVPKDQAGGAQRLMVTISFGKPDKGSFIATETHLNTLVYANIEGDANLNAEIVSHDIRGFSFDPSISTTSVLKNTSNTDLDDLWHER